MNVLKNGLENRKLTLIIVAELVAVLLLLVLTLVYVTRGGSADSVAANADQTAHSSHMNTGPSPTSGNNPNSVVERYEGEKRSSGAKPTAGARPTPGSKPSTDSKSATTSSEESSNGMTTFSGTVELWDTARAAGPRGPANEESPDNEYLVLAFDSPIDVTGSSGGGNQTRTETATHLRLAMAEYFQGSKISSDEFGTVLPFVGSHVTVTVDSGKVYFASDTSLPFGMPRASNFSISAS